jgi:pimeloyl-ACP methyl ester carboxylesterase/DNA-binding CsgD family transcriptional regulator
MTQQQIGFCTTSDGVRIAYATLGDGPPLVYATGWPQHLEVEWQKPVVRRFLEDLGRGFTLIRYDMRGSGLSDCSVSDFSLGSLLKDLEAVVDHLALERFPLLSLGDLGGPLGIMYATSHPERVSHLILNSPFARGCDIAPPEKQAAMIEYVARYGFPMAEFVDAPDGNLQALREIREIGDASAPRDVQAELTRMEYSVDVSELLGRVSTPTLILHALGDTYVPFALGRDVAARIPGAEFVPFEGVGNGPVAHRQVIVRELRRFLFATLHASIQAASEEFELGGRPDGLTAREVEVLKLVASGCSSREISEALVLSVRTVERHITNIYSKTGARTRAQATAYALARGVMATLYVVSANGKDT